MNTHGGVDRSVYEKVHEGVSYSNRNGQGEEILEQVVINDLAILNMYFYKSREQYIITYKSTVEKSVIDYLLVAR